MIVKERKIKDNEYLWSAELSRVPSLAIAFMQRLFSYHV